ncbi:MAG: hypothetical protein ACI8RD_005976 [Bacillariaceae sp.]|jgi:hypothetical protein
MALLINYIYCVATVDADKNNDVVFRMMDDAFF